MKKKWVCSIIALCMVLAGCAENQQKPQTPPPAIQQETPPEIQQEVQSSKLDASAPPEIHVYADAAEGGSTERRPIPDREEVTGFIYLEEDGTLAWIDDFDHAGDDLHFTREQP